MKIAVALGTRPEIVKLSSIIREAESDRSIDLVLIHSGQHYSYELDRLFFQELELKPPLYNLGVGSLSHNLMTARILERIEPVLIKERPDLLIAQGDTNTVLASILAALKLGIKTGHVEAGLRSYDRRMPEEHNRVVVDHLADFLFAPTREAAALLASEGLPSKRIFIVGNTIVDAVLDHRKLARKRASVLKRYSLEKPFLLATAHRPENVDQKKTLRELIGLLAGVADDLKLPVYWPIHPRSKKQLETFSLKLPGSIKLLPPLGFLEFLYLEQAASLILTDSGGIQEEACILKVPCLTMRISTERPETVSVGANKIVATDQAKAIKAARIMIKRRRTWRNPFGRGQSGKKILSILKRKLRQTT